MKLATVKLLLVQDDVGGAALTRRLLDAASATAFDVQCIAAVAPAADALVCNRYDVCLVDERPGGEDGAAFVNHAVERGCSTPFILLFTGPCPASDAVLRAAADCLAKPILSPELLERSIRYALQQQELQQSLSRLAIEQRTRAEAESASHAKDQFLAVLSHELRTPLSAVLMSAAAMEQDTALPESSQELLDIIKRNVELEARLIDDLLDLTRVARGKIEIRREFVNVHQLIDQAIRTCCQQDISDKRLHVQVEAHAVNHLVWGDPARLQQVLWNLMKNAVKFTPPQGRVTIATSNPSDNGSARSPTLVVEVSDTGIGIDAAALPTIFNAYEQAGRAITRKYGGLGLGLAICKALVEIHGGTISASSPGPDQGTTMTIRLPTVLPIGTSVPTTAAGSDGSPHAGVISRTKPVSILLVEDHLDTATAMSRLLNRRGYAVRTAANVADALRSADVESFDVLISDIGLPDGNGLELMRQLLTRRPIHGIALSGFGMEQDLEQSRAAGFTEHLTKPIDFSQLEAAIVRVTADGSR